MPEDRSIWEVRPKIRVKIKIQVIGQVNVRKNATRKDVINHQRFLQTVIAGIQVGETTID